MELAVSELAKSVEGKQALAVEAFARALHQLPTIIADNAGYDSAEIVQNLRSAVNNGDAEAGLNMYTGAWWCSVSDLSRGLESCVVG